jgi:hypothetical protein
MSILKILIHESLLRLSLSIHVETIQVEDSHRFVSRLRDRNGSGVYESKFCSSALAARQLAREYRDYLIHARRRHFEQARAWSGG